MLRFPRRRRFLDGLIVGLFLGCQVWGSSGECERLKTSLTYTQEEAPRDLSGVLPVVVGRINQVLEGVVDVEVEWQGADLQGKVGEHIVQCKVTRLASTVQKESNRQVVEGEEDAVTTTDEQGRQVVSQCFYVPFSILDTNECMLPVGHSMRHQCRLPSICVNTVGSYECLCPKLGQSEASLSNMDEEFWDTLATEKRNAWELSYNSSSLTSCPSSPSTHDCCPTLVHTKDGASCRSEFRCPKDPCLSSQDNDCVGTASCVRALTPVEVPNYTCECPKGFMGNGHVCRPGIDPKPEPKVIYDGVTPTEETIKNNFYCGCTKPVMDACSGFPPCKGKHEVCTVTAANIPQCACKPGYVKHEPYGCVDKSPPVLRLHHDPRGDQTLRLKQGDVYQEYAVDIHDENAEEYFRMLKIAYSQPLPNGCFTKTGEFHVNYTVATPWTSPPFVRITRRVMIEDIDECTLDVSRYQSTCPSLVPQCDLAAGATCVNTIGSYTCRCPQHTRGDGFKPGTTFKGDEDAPEGFQGGSGCIDTSKPVIQLRGANPKTFKVCECSGLSGIMGPSSKPDADLKAGQRRRYDNDIKEMIRSTAGAELCASHSNPKPNASDCVNAYDETYKGRVDLSREVAVGEPVQKGPLRWAVPYDVKDAAGNAATTVWRNVIVEEVDISVMENRIREEVKQERKDEIDKAVNKALAEERSKRGNLDVRNRRQTGQKCPECPKCDCSSRFDPSMCEGVCQAKGQTYVAESVFSVLGQTMAVQVHQGLSWVIPLVVAICVPVTLILFLQCVFSLFRPSVQERNYYPTRAEDKARQDSVTYYNNMDPTSANRGTYQPPRASSALGENDSFFSPQADIYAAGGPSDPYRNHHHHYTATTPPNGHGGSADDIYTPIITTNRSADGLRRRSNHSMDSR